MNEKYNCSKHGSKGDPSCRECWENLAKLLEDYGVTHIVSDNGPVPQSKIKL